MSVSCQSVSLRMKNFATTFVNSETVLQILRLQLQILRLLFANFETPSSRDAIINTRVFTKQMQKKVGE
jgi:hypothetical protein